MRRRQGEGRGRARRREARWKRGGGGGRAWRRSVGRPPGGEGRGCRRRRRRVVGGETGPAPASLSRTSPSRPPPTVSLPGGVRLLRLARSPGAAAGSSTRRPLGGGGGGSSPCPSGAPLPSAARLSPSGAGRSPVAASPRTGVPSARLGTRATRRRCPPRCRRRPPPAGGGASARAGAPAARRAPPAARPGRSSGQAGVRAISALPLVASPSPTPAHPPPLGPRGPGPALPFSVAAPAAPLPWPCPLTPRFPLRAPPPPSVARRGPGRGCGEGRGSAGRVFSPKARRGGGSRGCSSEARGSGRPRPRWLLGAGERPGREREAGCRAVAGPASRRPPGPGPSRAGSVGGLAPLAWRCRPRPAGGEDRRRGGGGGGLWPRSPAPRLARPPPPSVQVPSASRRGGLKTLWGSPVRLGSGRSGPRGGSVPSSRLRRLGPRHPVGCAGGGVATPRARSTRPPGGGSPPARWPSCRVRVRVRPPPPPRPRCGVGRGRWEPPGRLWGCPRSPPAPARARRGRRPDAPSFVRPFRPCRSLISWSLLAGQRRPPGMCRAREGGSPLRSKLVRLLAVDHSARASMKNAASCEN